MKKKKHKSPLSGKMTGKVSRKRTIDHMDPRSKQHADDKKYIKRVRDEFKKTRPDAFKFNLKDLKFPSLGGGFCINRYGATLSLAEHEELLENTQSERNFYLAENRNSKGKVYQRKRKTEPLGFQTVTFRPDYAMAFKALEEGDSDILKNFLIADATRVIAEDFEQATGLEVIAMQIHPEEGALHFHLTYSKVSAANELLWARGHPGKHGLRNLGPSGVAMLRLVADGLLDKEYGARAEKHRQDRLKSTQGEDPIDLRMALTLDALCERLFDQKGLEQELLACREIYKTQLLAYLNDKPEGLKRKLEKLEEENLRLKDAARERKEIMPNLEAPFAERLAPYLPREILRNAQMFGDVLDVFYAQGTMTARRHLFELATSAEIPLTADEQRQARTMLDYFDRDMSNPDYEREKTKMEINEYDYNRE